jgi:hypothetical protein
VKDAKIAELERKLMDQQQSYERQIDELKVDLKREWFS